MASTSGSDKTPREMTPLAVAVASLLDERPMHPYEIAVSIRQRHMQEAVKLTFGSLYHTVEHMLAAGLVEPLETSREGRRPERTVYRLTDSGRACFHKRLRDLLARPRKEYSAYEAGLAFMHHVSAAEAAELLAARVEALETEIEAQEQLLQTVRSRGLSRLSLIEVEHAQAMRRAEVEWARQVIDECESGSLEWVAGYQPKRIPIEEVTN